MMGPDNADRWARWSHWALKTFEMQKESFHIIHGVPNLPVTRLSPSEVGCRTQIKKKSINILLRQSMKGTSIWIALREEREKFSQIVLALTESYCCPTGSKQEFGVILDSWTKDFRHVCKVNIVVICME